MAISNYTELQSAIAGWLHRSNLDGRIPDFITLAESRINRLASVRAMEIEAPLTMTPGSRFVPLPDDYSVPIGMWLETIQPRQELSMLVPEATPVTTVPGWPQHWAIDGKSIAFERPADQPHKLTFRYGAQFELSDAAPTNALLTKYPDLYLYACLLESAPYIRNVDQMTVWQDRFDRAVREINANESRSRGVAPLRTEVAQIIPGVRFNINRGY